MEELLRFGVSMESGLLKEFDKLIGKKGYSNRSEAIRDLVRENIISENIQDEKSDSIGVLTFIYDHHKREIEDNLNEFQHDHFESIVSNTHIHLDHENCLEIILLKAKAGTIKHISDKILSFKGVKHGKLSLTAYTPGKTHTHNNAKHHH